MSVDVLDHKRHCALALLLLPIEFAAAADANEWTDAPAQWTDGLDVSAFCKPGEWYFEPFGIRARAVKPTTTADQHGDDLAGAAVSSFQFGESFATEMLLKAIGQSAASWLPGGPRADEVTALRMVRHIDGKFTIQALAGTTLAAWRIYKPRASKCQPGTSLRINTDSEMAHGVKTSLALASDGSLILRQDNFDDFFWPLLTLPEGGYFARFEAAGSEDRTPTSAN